MSTILQAVLRIVLDTSVVVAGLRSRRGASNELLGLVARGRAVALATPALFLEYEEVLKRSEQRAVHRLTDVQIERLLETLASVIEPVTVHIGWRPQLNDPADEMVLETAINGRANALATFNVRDFSVAGARFGISILRPGDVLKKV
jgi:putative PIN family toxin of toxin-antitoxin system